MINSENILPSRLKDLAVQCKVPVKELVKLFAEVGLILNHKPSTKITPEQINAVLPQVRIYLQSSHPITRKTQKRIDKNKKTTGKKSSQSELKVDIIKSVDGFGTKNTKQKKKKNKVKPKKITIIYTPMKS
jgi:hypothetical protein